jgi:small subunit ribosomal protein S16
MRLKQGRWLRDKNQTLSIACTLQINGHGGKQHPVHYLRDFARCDGRKIKQQVSSCCNPTGHGLCHEDSRSSQVVRIRLKRMGRTHRPFYRISVMDARKARDGKTIEDIGFYDPMVQDKSQRVNLDVERLDYWVGVGAQPTEKVAVLIKKLRNNKWGVTNAAPPQTAPKQPEPPVEEPVAEVAETEAAEAPAEASSEE